MLQDDVSARVRFATLDDIARIQDFVRVNWKSKHLFARDDRVLLWQHYDRPAGRLNFVIAEDVKRQLLLGLLGFIPTSQFDPKLADEKDYWLALWKVREEVGHPGLGLQLLFHLLGELKPKTLSILGYTQQASAIYRSLRYVTGLMTQFFHLNVSYETFSIASVPTGYNMEVFRKGDDASLDILPIDEASIQELDELFVAGAAMHPVKTPIYFINRYLRHPRYRYDIRAVRRGTKILGCWALRLIVRPEGRVLRGVDCILDPEAGADWMLPSINRLLREYGAEYWDFYAMGAVAQLLQNAGFAYRVADEIVIPNYFEPFVRANVDILYAVKPPLTANYGCVKGDADQDRPS